MLVGFMAFLVAVDGPAAVSLCHVILATKSPTLGSTAIELDNRYRRRVTKPESRGAGANFDVFRSKIHKIFFDKNEKNGRDPDLGPKNEKNGRDPDLGPKNDPKKSAEASVGTK